MYRGILAVLRKLGSIIQPRRISPVSVPLSFTDGESRDIHIRPYTDEDFNDLADMYDEFDSAQRAQGTPPTGADAVRDWLTDVLDGVNVIALHDDRVVGHVCFVPDGTGRHELAIFVHQEYQQAGIGPNLMAAGMGHAQDNGVTYVWLSVESWKRNAQRLYNRAGFSTVNPMGAAHRMSRYL